MKQTIKELIENYILEGLTLAEARSFVAQQIILSKIEKSFFADKILLKGGVVMYNITKEKRRTTIDLDFDFSHYDISNNRSIKTFIKQLNSVEQKYDIKIKPPIIDLHHQDYRGKRVNVVIVDKTYSINFKMDIGVHTLLGINQEKMLFAFNNGEKMMLLSNPPEQILAEKLFSLAKLGIISQRFKDIDDMYYLIKEQHLNVGVVRECLRGLTVFHPYGIDDIQDIINKVDECLNDQFFIQHYHKSDGCWTNEKYEFKKETILDFIDKL